MEEKSGLQRCVSIDDQLIEEVSKMLGLDRTGTDINGNREYWKEKFEEADATLQSCEKNRRILEKQNEDLKKKHEHQQKAFEDAKATMTTLRARNETLEKQSKTKERIKEEQVEAMTELQKELVSRKEIVRDVEQRLKESQEEVVRRAELIAILESVNEKANQKAVALEIYVEALVDIKGVYETKIKEMGAIIKRKESEVKETMDKLNAQAEILEAVESETTCLKEGILEIQGKFENCYKMRDMAEIKFHELRELYATNSDKLSDECYSLNVSLQKAYSDCDVYCRKIEESERTIEGLNEEICTGKEKISTLEGQVNERDGEISTAKVLETELKSRQSELELNDAEQKDEIRKLREMFDAAKAQSESLENMFGQKTSDCEENENKYKDASFRIQTLEARLREEQDKHSVTLEVKEKLLQENSNLQGKIKMLQNECDQKEKKEHDLGHSLNAALEETGKVKKELEKASDRASEQEQKYQELAGNNHCLIAVNDENEQEIAALKSHMEKLKGELWTLREKSIEIAAAADVVEKFKERCCVLNEEKSELLAVVERLRIDNNRLARLNEEQREAIWKARQGRSVAQSRITDLEKALLELRDGKELENQKVQQMQREYTEQAKDSERRWEQKLKEKEVEYEKQLKRKEANEILLRRMDDQLKQKEAQLEVKRGELKRMLVQCSDLKNDKMRCEKKIESLQFTERTLSGKVERLEPRLSQLEEREKELVMMVKQKEAENKNINERWEKLATAGVEEIAKAIWD